MDRGQRCTLALDEPVESNQTLTAVLRSSVTETLRVEQSLRANAPVLIVTLSDTSRSGLLSIYIGEQQLPPQYVRVFGKVRTLQRNVLGAPIPPHPDGRRYSDQDTIFEVTSNGQRIALPRVEPTGTMYRFPFRTSPLKLEVYDHVEGLYHSFSTPIPFAVPSVVVTADAYSSAPNVTLTVHDIDLKGASTVRWLVSYGATSIDTVSSTTELRLRKVSASPIIVALLIDGTRFELGTHPIAIDTTTPDNMSIEFNYSAPFEVSYVRGREQNGKRSITDSGIRVIGGHHLTEDVTFRRSGDSVVFASNGSKVDGWVVVSGSTAHVYLRHTWYDQETHSVATATCDLPNATIITASDEEMHIRSAGQDFVASDQFNYASSIREGHNTVTFFYDEYLVRQLDPINAEVTFTIRWTP